MKLQELKSKWDAHAFQHISENKFDNLQMKKEIDKIDYYNLRKMLVEIYDCVSAWDNDDGKMAEANEKTPEDILAKIIENAKNEGRKEVLNKYKEIYDNNLEL